MWAAFRNNVKMSEILLDYGADLTLEDEKGLNALDICITKMNYETALFLTKRGLQPKIAEAYMDHLWRKYDVELFINYLKEERQQVEYDRFFDLIKCNIRACLPLIRAVGGVAQQRPRRRHAGDMEAILFQAAEFRRSAPHSSGGAARRKAAASLILRKTDLLP